jgi:hypothetical protein
LGRQALPAVLQRGVTPMVAAVLVYMFGLLCMYVELAFAAYNFPTFVALFVLTFLVVRPKRAISPLTIFYAYYGLWYVLAPMFAQIYQDDVLRRPEYLLSLTLMYTPFGLGVIAIQAGEHYAQRATATPAALRRMPLFHARMWVAFLYLSATLCLALIVWSTGGPQRWIANPGEAFLNREGSGVYVILSHFFTIALAVLSGYLGYQLRRKWPVLCFLLWVLLTSPVHGSKGFISMLVLLAVAPWLKDMRFFSGRSYLLYGSLLGIFFLGLYFRNVSWLDLETVVPYALNYFTTLERMAMAVRDFEPQFMLTFLMPFVKFLTPFGLQDPSMYFDMNQFLTDRYFPHAWEIRATEQWPVETDLYLNFYFFGGLPLVAAFLFVTGAIFAFAVRRNSLGAWFAAIVLTVSMVSHLRGSLINHVDFYMYPYIALLYFCLRRLPIARPDAARRRRS